MYKMNIIKAKKFKKEYEDILKEIKFIGITGTNGKTTTTTLLYKYLRYYNYKVTLIGTNGIYINDEYYESINTTPGVDLLYEIINKSYKQGVRIIIMEVSSHAIVQNRIYGIKFYIKAITNITQDHLDYHKTFNKYKKVKLSFLKNAIILINDELKIRKKVFSKVYKYGKNNSYFRIENIELNNDYTYFKLSINGSKYFIKSNLLGEFNAYNLTLFISVLFLLKIFDYNNLQIFLNNNLIIDGRMEKFNYKQKTIIVDYAHTPDGFEKILSFVRKTNNNKKVITMFGCGGNRDRFKRNIMGSIASKYSNFLILTSDNPRSEDENDIIKDILLGVNTYYTVEINRKKAIDLGMKMLEEYDILLILGRGCEKNIVFKDTFIEFNDVEYIKGIVSQDG